MVSWTCDCPWGNRAAERLTPGSALRLGQLDHGLPLGFAAVPRHLLRDVAPPSRNLEAGADSNATQHGGWAPLMAAEEHGDQAVIDLLVAHGAQPTSENRSTTS